MQAIRQPANACIRISSAEHPLIVCSTCDKSQRVEIFGNVIAKLFSLGAGLLQYCLAVHQAGPRLSRAIHACQDSSLRSDSSARILIKRFLSIDGTVRRLRTSVPSEDVRIPSIDSVETYPLFGLVGQTLSTNMVDRLYLSIATIFPRWLPFVQTD